MRVKKIYLPGIAGGSVADSIAATQDATADTPLVLEAGAASIDPPQEILFTFDADSSAVDFTIVGLNRRGMPITEVVEGGSGTARSKGIYSSITSITPDTTDAATFSVGNVGENVSPWIMMNTIHSHDFTAYGNAMTYEDPELNNGPCTFEFTHQNVMRDGEEVAFQVSGSTLDGTVGGQVDLPPCTFFRVRNEESATNVAVAITRPGF